MKLANTPIYFLLCVSVVFTSCQREEISTSDQQEHFVKTFDGPDDEGAFSTQILNNGEILIFGTRYQADQLQVLHTDKYGNEISRRSFASNSEYFVPVSLKLPNGEIIVTGKYSTDFYKFDKDGNFISHSGYNQDWNAFIRFSKPILGDDGTILISGSGGFGPWAYNPFAVLDQDGKLLYRNAVLQTSVGGGQITQLNIIKGDSMGMLMIGTKYPTDNWLYSDNVVPFVFEFKDTGSWWDMEYEIFDQNENEDSDVITAYEVGADKSSILVTSHRTTSLSATVMSLPQQCEVQRFNSEGKRLWKRKMRIDNVRNLQVNTVRLLDNGDILLAGLCLTMKNAIQQAFLVRLDANGSYVSDKVYDFMGASEIIDIQIADNQDLILTGLSSTFGKGLLGADILLLRTDQNGEFE